MTPAGAITSVQAVGVMPGLYYRMDAEIAPGQVLDWPVDEVLARLGIPAEAVGIVGVRYVTGRLPVFVPLQVAPQDRQIDTRTPLVAVLKPSDPLAQIRWRFTSGGQGAAEAWQAIPMQTYKAEIVLAVANEPLAGQLQVSWVSSGTGVVHTANFNIGP